MTSKTFRVLYYCLIFIFCSIPTIAQAALIFSEYVEGSGFNKALEIYNSGLTTVNLSNYSVDIYANGSSSINYSYSLTPWLLPSSGYFVLADSSADAAILIVAGQTDDLLFNGNDAITLANNGTIVDSIGQIGFDPGSEWGTGAVSTQNHTLRRKAGILTGDIVTSDSFDPAFEWDGYDQDTFDGLRLDGGPPVPIPGAVWLLGSGLLGLVGIRTKFKRNTY